MKNLRLSELFVLLIIHTILISSSSCKDESNNSATQGNFTILSKSESGLKAGFAAIPVTPQVPDKWIDVNRDAEYNPNDGDTFTDGNGNGKFDPVWIAGFGNRRAAAGIHDDLWARTMVIDNGQTRLAIVSLDAIGFMYNCVNDVRKMISPENGITYIIITSTHTHEGPDLLGLWGKSSLKSGVNKEYLEYVKVQIVRSVEEAVKNLHPAHLEISEDLTGAASLVEDSRKPDVLDAGLRMIRAIDNVDGKTLGTLISWSNHPETLWGRNLLITSDFPHYLREGIEKGIFKGDSLAEAGAGGVSVYINGAIGGLMTTSPGMAVKDHFSGKEYKDPSFEKAKAQGEQLALLALTAMKKPVQRIDSASISLIVRTIRVPLHNKMFKIAKIIGLLDRGSPGLRYMLTEMAVFKIGPISFATLPGEVYPEIINGGIEAPAGNDFSIAAVQVPSIREMMTGRFRFIIGLANDEIGYIIPESEWDTKPPFTYGRTDAPYGEENSMGPETAPVLFEKLKEMLVELR
jgi:hypothetical protein